MGRLHISECLVENYVCQSDERVDNTTCFENLDGCLGEMVVIDSPAGNEIPVEEQVHGV